jgi:signal transduction histidine kinase
LRVNSLTTRFLLALLFCTAVPFLGFGLYVRSEVRDREAQQVLRVYLPRWADDAARKIATDLRFAHRVGWLLAGEAESYLRTDGGMREFEEMVDGLYSVNKDFDMVLLADETGKVIEVTRNARLDEERSDELDLLRPKSVKGFAWFQAVSERVDQCWVPRHSSPFLHRTTTTQSKDPTDYSLGVAFQVQTKNGFGALFILLRWDQVQDVIDETTRFLRSTESAGFQSAEVFLADANGQVLAHSNRARYGDHLTPESLSHDLASRATGYAIFTDASGEEFGFGFASAKRHIDGDGFDWRVGLHVPTRELFEVSRDFEGFLLLVIPVIALLMIALAVISSRAIVRPVRRLSDATRKVAQGDLEARVEVHGGDELADLGRAFNTMAEDLAKSREQLRDAERQAAWAEMARQVAHEIKNPLTPMRMGAQLLLRARREDDPRWKDLSGRLARNVLQQTDALDRIASDFRQFAGSPARDVNVLAADDLLGGVAELLASMAEESAIDLTFEADADGVDVAVDVLEMRRVFLNLIHNAMQACGEAGSVRVRSSVSVSGAEAGAEAIVEFRVEDDGSGVPEEMRARLFDPYFTTKTSGSGLGLAICRRIMQAHGGDIELECSAPPRTVFLVVLPVAPTN